MKIIYGNLFRQKCDAICITTNGIVKKNGCAVMGKGVAKQAKDEFKGIEKRLGKIISDFGNNVSIIYLPNAYKMHNKYAIVSFPVKHNWWEKADMNLILESCRQLVLLTNTNNWSKIVLPRPGCENGGLDWDDIMENINSILDDRFYIIELRKKNEEKNNN